MRSARSRLAAPSWNSLNRRSLVPSETAAARTAALSSRVGVCLRSVEVGARPSVWSNRLARQRRSTSGVQ